MDRARLLERDAADSAELRPVPHQSHCRIDVQTLESVSFQPDLLLRRELMRQREAFA